MGRALGCDTEVVKRGYRTPEEDHKLLQHIKTHGHCNWRSLPRQAGLRRCGQSCRRRWVNYLRPDIKRGAFSPEEEATIVQLHGLIGNKWTTIASQLPGRTDNDIKNFCKSRRNKRFISMNDYNQLDNQTPSSSKPGIVKCVLSESRSTRHIVKWESVSMDTEASSSMESMMLNSSLVGKRDSEVGESSCKIPTIGGKKVCRSDIPQTSPRIKQDPDSFVMPNERHTGTSSSAVTTNEEDDVYKRIMEGCSFSSSNEFSDSSDTSLKLLRDFHGGDDMDFLSKHIDDASNFFDLRCD